jgi:ABC-2 type transport system ATP-binding protein
VIAAALHGAVKRFGETTALDGVDLEVRAGEVVALLGPNGAGKTTALSLLIGLRRPDAGRVELFGRDPRIPAARAAIGVTPQESGFPPTLRVREIVDLVRAHFAHPAPTEDLLARFGLEVIARRQAGGLSGGERRRLSVAIAFAGRPRALFLDEPSAGLDVETRRGVWREVRAYAAGGGTVLLTTHYLEEAEALASRVVLIARGAIVAEGSPSEVSARACASGLEEAFVTLTSPSTAGGDR